MSAFSPVPERPEPEPLVSKGHRLCERWWWSDWGQAIWDSTVSCVSALPHHCLPCVRIKGPIFSFSSPGIFMRNPWVYSTRNGLLQSRNSSTTTSAVLPSHFFPFLLSRSVRETSCSNIYEEKTQVIKVEDLPTCASACNMLLCGLGFLLLFLSPSAWTKTWGEWWVNKSRL